MLDGHQAGPQLIGRGLRGATLQLSEEMGEPRGAHVGAPSAEPVREVLELPPLLVVQGAVHPWERLGNLLGEDAHEAGEDGALRVRIELQDRLDERRVEDAVPQRRVDLRGGAIACHAIQLTAHRFSLLRICSGPHRRPALAT